MALITGGLGFLGAHVARLLVQQGCQVFALACRDSDLGRLRDALHLVTGDVLDGEQMADVVQGARPELCLHLAWYAEPGVYLSSPLNVQYIGASLHLATLLAGLLPISYAPHKVYAASYPPGVPATDITNHINAGRILVNYVGHGNTDQWGLWSGGSIYNLTNLPSLTNAHKLSVVTVGNCLNGYFAGPYVSVGEGFLGLANAGAVAAWAPADLGYTSGHSELLAAFYQAIFRDDQYAVGAAAVAAELAAYGRNSALGELVQSYILFGDPAMKLGIPTNYPYLVGVTPANGAPRVPPSQPIHVQFSKRMDPASVMLTVQGAPGATFTPVWNADNTAVDYSHPSLQSGQVTVTISGQDRLGNALGPGLTPTTWSFKVTQTLYLPVLRRRGAMLNRRRQ
jgi:hypothetical protein